MQVEILLLGFFACCMTLVPMGYVLARLIDVYNNQVEEKKIRIHGQTLLIGFTASIFFMLYMFAHQDTFTGLDVACYRQLAECFSEDIRGFHDVDTIYESIPDDIQKDFLYRPKGRLTRDLIFELNIKSCSTEPFFLPMLSLGAGIFPDIDLFVPICGSIWFASLLAFGLCKGKIWGLFSAVFSFFITFWPMWFLRGFHTDAVGSILVGTALLAALTPQMREGKRNVFVIGFLLGCSIGYHFTMVVPAGIVAVFLLLTKGWTFRRLLWLVLGGAIGLIPMLYQLVFICAPYGNILSFSSFANMVSNVKEIRFLAVALFSSIVVFICFASVILNNRYQDKIHEFLEKYASRINPVIIVITIAVWLFYAFCAGPITAGFSTIQSGLVYALPLIIFVVVLLSISRQKDSAIYCALSLMLTLMTALFLYIKGVEVHVGLWSQRRFFPVVAMFIPLLIVALCKFNINGKFKNLTWVLFFISFIPIFRWPVAYVGVFDASSNEAKEKPSITTEIDDFIDENNNLGKSIFIFDYYLHSVPFQHDLERCVLGVGEHARWNYPEVLKWAFETSKTNKSDAFFFSSYAYAKPMLEECVVLQPIGLVSDQLERYSTKGVFPLARNDEKGLIKICCFIMEEPTRNSIQNVSFEKLYPLGLRQPWGRTTRYGTWSRQGSGIVGPIPENGGKVVLSILAQWTPPVTDGTWLVQNLIIETPFGIKKTIQISADNELGGTICEIQRPIEDNFGDSVTGVYRFYVEQPYNPSQYGIKGFDQDLGVIFKSVLIKCIE